MRTCEQNKNDFVEALYGELDSRRQRSLQAHLKTCAECRREFESLRRTLEVMSRRQRPPHRAPLAEAASAARKSGNAGRPDDERQLQSGIEALRERILSETRELDGSPLETAAPLAGETLAAGALAEQGRQDRGPQAVAKRDAQGRDAGAAYSPPASAGGAQPAAIPQSRPNWRWLMQMAAGIALIALGVLIGRMTMNQAPSPDGTPARMAAGTDSSTRSADQAESQAGIELARRVGGYVSRSQALLVGLANLDTEAEGMEVFDLDPQRRLSRHLLSEASYLRSNLDGQESRELVELIADLESILRQIANLETRHDVEGIDIIRHGVESSGILIKIQLQKIRPHPVVREQDAKKRDAA